MKKIIAILIFAIALQGTASAQLGGILNKAKEKVKKEAQKQEEKIVGTEKTDPIQEPANASAQADDIDPILGVSMSALNKSYENLDYNIYIYPHRPIPGLYYTKSANDTYSEQQLYRMLITWQMTSGDEAPCIVYEPEPFAFVAVPADVIINANFALFRAFPAQTYPFFMEARMLIRAMEEGRISLDYENPNTLVAYTQDGGVAFKQSDNLDYGFAYKNPFIVGAPRGNDGEDQLKKLVHWKAEEARLMELYKKYVPFENVKNSFFNTMVGTVRASKEKRWSHGVYESYKLAIIAEDMQSHPNKVEDQDYIDGLATYENLKTNNYPKWEAFIKNQWVDMYAEIKESFGSSLAEMPTAATSDPKLESEMIAIAKTIYEDGRVPVKAVIKNPDWTYTRNAFGVIIDRFQTAYIIFKMTDGSYRMVDIGFKQLYDGSSYGKTQLRGIGMVNAAVDYR